MLPEPRHRRHPPAHGWPSLSGWGTMRRVEFIDAMFNRQVLLATGVYAVLAALEPFLERWITQVFHDNPPALWFQQHLGIPLLRTACVLLFVHLAYPGLFGLRAAPDLHMLLAEHETGPSTMLGLAFLVALVAPVVPMLHRHPELVLPIQGMLATAFLFDWMTDYLHMSSISIWPGTDIMALAFAGAWIMHRLGRRLGRLVGETADAMTDSAGYDSLAVHVVTMLAQLPVILVYSTGLASQIAI